MEKLEYKLLNITKMISNLERSIKKIEKVSEEYREFIEDSIAARFKILIESSWKMLKLHMENLGVADLPGSLKEILFVSMQNNILTKFEYDKFIHYIKLRNLASHIYSLVIDAAPEAIKLIKEVKDRITKNMKVLNFE